MSTQYSGSKPWARLQGSREEVEGNGMETDREPGRVLGKGVGGGGERPELRLAHWEGLLGREVLLFQPGGTLKTQAATEETGGKQRGSIFRHQGL